MVKALKFFIVGILLFSTEQAVSCTCKEDLGCEIVDRIMVAGRVEKIIREDGSLLKPGEDFMKAGDDLILLTPPELIADFKVLNSDNKSLIGKTIKIKAGGGTNCDCGIYYGLVHFELYQVKRESGKITSSIGSCTPKKSFSDKASLNSHFKQRLAVKKNCKKERLIGHWRFVKYETPTIDDHAFSENPRDLILREDMTFTEPGSPNDTSIDGTWTFKDAESELVLNYNLDDHGKVHNATLTRKVHKLEANKLWLVNSGWLVSYEKIITAFNGGEPLEFVQVSMLRNSEEKRDSLINMWLMLSREKLAAKVPSDKWFDGKVYFTIKILPTGEVYEVEVVRGVKEAEPYYDAFMEEIGKAIFPKIKSNSGQGFQPYRITFPLTFKRPGD